MKKLTMVPDACTLPTAAQPLREAEFEALFEHHLTGRKRVDPTTLDLEFPDEPGLAETIEELTARESSCCAFFSFTLHRDEGLRLRVAVPEQYIDVLTGLQALAEA